MRIISCCAKPRCERNKQCKVLSRSCRVPSSRRSSPICPGMTRPEPDKRSASGKRCRGTTKRQAMKKVATTISQRSIGMKLSARNVLSGKVTEVSRGPTTARVKVQLDGGATVTSSITTEAADDLKLAAGDKVSAIIKASDVMIGK